MRESQPPTLSAKGGRRERLQSIGHYLAALVLALEGVSRLEHGDGLWMFIALCWLSAILIIVLTLFHHRLQHRFPESQAVMHLGEAAVCAGMIFITRHEGKVGVPFAWLIAAILLASVAVFEFVRFRRVRRATP